MGNGKTGRGSMTDKVSRQDTIRRLLRREGNLSMRAIINEVFGSEDRDRSSNDRVRKMVQRDIEDMGRDIERKGSGRGTTYELSKSAKAAAHQGDDALLILTLMQAAARAVLPKLLLARYESLLEQWSEYIGRRPLSEMVWADRLRVLPAVQPTFPAEADESVLDAVANAVSLRRGIRFLYHDRDGKHQVAAMPLGLVQRGAILYLIGAVESGAVERWTISRISKVEQADVKATTPDNWDIDRYLQSPALHFGTGKKVQLKTLVTPNLARRLTEERLSESQPELDLDAEGWQDFEIKIEDTWQLRWWIMSQHFDLIVTEPRYLRKVFADLHRHAHRHYEALGNGGVRAARQRPIEPVSNSTRARKAGVQRGAAASGSRKTPRSRA